ncbi:MAG: hypothetical protein N2D54_07335, partial [Chloroflexota bacterium]
PTEPPTPAPTATPALYIARGRVDSPLLNLRSGPSTMHGILQSFFEGEELYAKAQVPEGDWVQVEIGENHQNGWMATDYIQWLQSPEQLFVFEWPQLMTIRGNVLDSFGEPIDNLVVAAIFRDDDEKERTENTTNENGEFVFYLPEDKLDQIISVEAIGPNCGSRIMNADCTVVEYFELEDQFYVTPPQQEPITFMYEEATAKIIGKVTTRGGWAIHNIVVFASRSEDGADAQTITNDKGEFTLSVGPGEWRVVAIRFVPYQPGQESEPAIVTLSEGDETPTLYIVGPWQAP